MGRLLYSRYWPTFERVLPLAALVVYLAGVVITAGMFSIDDTYVRYALACVVVQAVSLLLLSAGLIGGKRIAVTRGERRQRTVDRISSLFAQFSFDPVCRPDLLSAAREHPSEFLDVWQESLSRLKGSSRQRVEEILIETGLDQQTVGELANPDPGQVLRAIALLRKMENPPLAALEKALDHPADVVRMAARITIIARGSSQGQERILSQLSGLPFWQRVVLFQQIPADSSALQHYLTLAFEAGEETEMLAALEFIISSQRLQPIRAVKRLAGSSSVEVRIKFFKALPFLASDEDTVPILQLGLDDLDWRARAMAARACGVLRVASLGPELLRRFACATNPVEASHLAGALAALQGDAWRRLQEFTRADNDMTRAIATDVIEKHLAHHREQPL